MALEALEKTLFSASDELLLLCIITAADTEADVHAAADASVRNNLVHLRELVQSTVDKLCLLVGYFLLPANFLSAELGHQVGHDLAGNPEVEDGEGVVEGIVLCGDCVVENYWAGKTANVQPVEESRGRSRGLGREEILANDGNGDTGDTNVFLCAALYILLVYYTHDAERLKSTYENDRVFADINLPADEVGAHIGDHETLIFSILTLSLQ